MDNLIAKNLEAKVAEAVNFFKSQLAGIRGGRPTAKMIEDITIDYLGTKLTIKQLGTILVVLPREIQVSVWDKQAASLIAKAIETALNVNPNIENNLVRINLPPLSGERRQDMTKVVKKEAEQVRIEIRSLRDETNKEINKQFDEKKFSEDDKFKLKDQIQKIIDKSNEEIEKSLEVKIKEIEE